jgi:hypothetical protein
MWLSQKSIWVFRECVSLVKLLFGASLSQPEGIKSRRPNWLIPYRNAIARLLSSVGRSALMQDFISTFIDSVAPPKENHRLPQLTRKVLSQNTRR